MKSAHAHKPQSDIALSTPKKKPSHPKQLTFIDLFAGIGGFHVAASRLNMKCVFASDIDAEARKAYESNFGLAPHGDITQIAAEDIPDHDVLCGGFPCQPFSIIGSRKGVSDPRGTLFLEILRIIEAKKPSAVFLENVKQLATMNKGETLSRITTSLEALGYTVQCKVLNALNFGLPQKRERVMIVGLLKNTDAFAWPSEEINMQPLSALLERKPDEKHFVSERIRLSRHAKHTAAVTPSVWHENKSGNISSHPYSCALRAGASYNYLLVDGKRRLTPREMLRLQGFPDSYKIVCNDSQTRKQAGNSVPVPMIEHVMRSIHATL